jgi:hypothetical protein
MGPVMGVGAGVRAGVEVDVALEEVGLGAVVAVPVEEGDGVGDGGGGRTPAIATPAGVLIPVDLPVMAWIGAALTAAPVAYSITLSHVPSPRVPLPVNRFPAPSIAMASGRSSPLMTRLGGVSALHLCAYTLMLPVPPSSVALPLESASE